LRCNSWCQKQRSMSEKTELVPFWDHYSFLNAQNYLLTEHLHRACISCALDMLFQNTHTQ
jgi:hypothetical protein